MSYKSAVAKARARKRGHMVYPKKSRRKTVPTERVTGKLPVLGMGYTGKLKLLMTQDDRKYIHDHLCMAATQYENAGAMLGTRHFKQEDRLKSTQNRLRLAADRCRVYAIRFLSGELG
jgi:hypothetical protein